LAYLLHDKNRLHQHLKSLLSRGCPCYKSLDSGCIKFLGILNVEELKQILLQIIPSFFERAFLTTGRAGATCAYTFATQFTTWFLISPTLKVLVYYVSLYHQSQNHTDYDSQGTAGCPFQEHSDSTQ
jgi:hypothetical protein